MDEIVFYNDLMLNINSSPYKKGLNVCISRTQRGLGSGMPTTHVGHATLGDVLLRVEDAFDGPGRQLLDLALQQRLHHVRQAEHLPLARRARQPAKNPARHVPVGWSGDMNLFLTDSHWSNNKTKHFPVHYLVDYTTCTTRSQNTPRLT